MLARDNLYEVLEDIDVEFYETYGDVMPQPVLTIAGGAAFIIGGMTDRNVTHDIDVVSDNADSALFEIALRHAVVNANMSAFADNLPYEYESRLIDLDVGTHVRFTRLGNEDLAVLKLYAMRGNDEVDLGSTSFSDRLDWQLMDEVVYIEAPMSKIDPSSTSLKEMQRAYEEYSREHGHVPNVQGLSKAIPYGTIGEGDPEHEKAGRSDGEWTASGEGASLDLRLPEREDRLSPDPGRR